ncbi:MAG: LacI family DNA-binding transcriptional regulator [Treponema sp.]|nr:LacI family DNA-binding transcriptional regulator [Treponema sp.]
MTITEIAKEAGVSIATVSRFLNNGPVKEETRKKLEQVIRKMNYVPESFTKKLLSSSSEVTTIAIITHSMTNPYTTEFVEEVSTIYNTRSIVCYTVYCIDTDTEYRYLMDLIAHKVDGIILHDPDMGDGKFELYDRLAQRVPFVLIHSSQENVACNSITVNQEQGMRDAMAYLIGLGHRRIAYICGSNGYSFRIKEIIWKEELRKIGVEVPEQDCVRAESVDFEKGMDTTHDAVLRYLKEGNRPTAIFAANDIIALGTIMALSEVGLSVPEDVSVMSHDNTLFARLLNLTCVDMKIRSVGIASVDLMDYAMKGSDTTPRHISLTPSIVERNSCRSIAEN